MVSLYAQTSQLTLILLFADKGKVKIPNLKLDGMAAASAKPPEAQKENSLQNYKGVHHAKEQIKYICP